MCGFLDFTNKRANGMGYMNCINIPLYLKVVQCK